LEISDQDLIQRCLSGRQDAFAALITRYQKLVFRVVTQMAGNTGEVDDLSQEVFLRVYRSLGTYRSEYRFATWLIKIATHVCFDSFRRRRPVALEPEDAAQVSDPRPGPDVALAESGDLDDLRRAVQELPEEYRAPLVLFHQQGLSYRELIEVLNEPESIIKNRLYRARRMLREKLIPQKEAMPT